MSWSRFLSGVAIALTCLVASAVNYQKGHLFLALLEFGLSSIIAFLCGVYFPPDKKGRRL